MIDTVGRLLAATDGLSVCHDPPAEPPVPGTFEPLPPDLHPDLATSFTRHYPGGLYRHQRAALDHLLAGRHTVVATRTSSGKSLIYSAPVLNALLHDPDATALFLFPQKALANDQLGRLCAAADDLPAVPPGGPPARISSHGTTGRPTRTSGRRSASRSRSC